MHPNINHIQVSILAVTNIGSWHFTALIFTATIYSPPANVEFFERYTVKLLYTFVAVCHITLLF